MSAIDTKQVWSSISNDGLDSKYEKCRNITEEIYKRIDITFQIKKLETGTQSDDSDQSDVIDSNELSNETDLFACDKSSISSSEPERQTDKHVNINNNEEPKKKAVVVCKRPRKRFRKRVKKRQPAAECSDSDASSDSALPLSRMLVDPGARSEADDFKPRIKTPDRKPSKHTTDKKKPTDTTIKAEAMGQTTDNAQAMGQTTDNAQAMGQTTDNAQAMSQTTDNAKVMSQTTDNAKVIRQTTDAEATDKIDEAAIVDAKTKVINMDLRSCSECSLSFRGERGLRRHMNMIHFTPTDKYQRGAAPF